MAKNAVREEISVKRLAEVIGVGERWLQQLETQGVIAKTRHGRYLLAESVQAYIKFKVDSEVARVTPSETNAGERVKEERARKLKLENDEKELRLVQTPDAVAALDAIVGPLVADLAGVPAKVTSDVAERRRIEDAIDTVLRGLADRFAKAGSDLRAGRDPLAADDEDDA
ncbi:MAG TPA: hypothetical protein PK264_12995 [Hyphomicrobiaceae bacterium]|nr:hypothetical protein [Hyphomicrobiaceae bacterium]